MFTNVDKKVAKSCKNFSCEFCSYYTSNKYNYKKHLLTAKHKMFTNVDIKVAKVAKNDFICKCGKIYKHRQSLYVHKKKCTYIQDDHNIIQDTTDYKSLFIDAMKQIAKQNEQITELIPKVGNNNNTFNIQMFLDKQCKNAMSIQDFVKTIQLNMENLTAIANNGYVKSVSEVLIKALNNLEVTDRPLHCTDLKRETVYIKDEDTWNKSNSKDKLMNNMILDVENKHYNLVSKYCQTVPNANELDTPECNFRDKALENVLGNCEKREQLNPKIYKIVLPLIKLNNEEIQNAFDTSNK